MDNEILYYTESDCLVCEYPLQCTWTDRHGEAFCLICGTPYQLLHFDKNDEYVERGLPLFSPPSEFLPVLRDYWNETTKDNGLGTYITHNPRAGNRRRFMNWVSESEWSYLLEEEE